MHEAINDGYDLYIIPYGTTRPQWVNLSTQSATCMHQWVVSAFVQIMACRLFGAKPLSEQMLVYCQMDR